MFGVLCFWTYLCFTFAAGRHDSLVHEGVTGRIRQYGRSMQEFEGNMGRHGDHVRSRAAIDAPARRLLQKADLDLSEALLKAAIEGDLDTVESEVEAGADPDMREPVTDATPLILASAKGHTDVVLFLLQEGADIDASDNLGYTPLYTAVLYGELEVVEILVDAGAEVDPTTEEGATPLYIAAQNGNEDIVEILIEAEADTEGDFFDDQTTSLIIAAINGHFEVVVDLISAGADVDAKDETTLTALHYASRLRRGARIITALVDAGANVDAQSDEGITPLHFAAYFGLEGNIETLLDAGADTTLRTEAASGYPLGSTAEEFICACLQNPDSDPEGLCDINACTDEKSDLLDLFD